MHKCTLGLEPSRIQTDCSSELDTAMQRMSRTVAGECGTMASISVLETTRAAQQHNS